MFEIAADVLPHGAGIRDGAIFVLRQIEGGVVGKAGHAPALLVHGDKQRRLGGGLQIIVETFDLFRVADVLAKLADAAHGVGAQRIAHSVGQFDHAVCLGIVDGFLRKGQIQRVGAHDEKLPDLLLQC